MQQKIERDEGRGKMRFSFLTNAKTIGTMGTIAGIVGIVTGFVAPGGGFSLAAGALAMAFIGYRQQRKQAEIIRTVYAALVLGLVAMAVSIASAFFRGARPV